MEGDLCVNYYEAILLGVESWLGRRAALLAEDYHLCNVCGLNRATLHLDEVVDGTIQMTAHLCDDCWYRLGIRIPLGNIWRHIHHHREQGMLPLSDPTKEVEDLLAEDDLGELLDTSPLAVAEPGEKPDVGDDLASFLESDAIPPEKEAISHVDPTDAPLIANPPGSHGIDAVRIDSLHPALVSLVPMDLLRRSKAIPVKLEGERLTIAVADPFDAIGIERLSSFLRGLNMVLVLAFADELEILRELNRHSNPPRRFDPLS